MSTIDLPFEYSAPFEAEVRRFLQDHRGLPRHENYVAQHLGGVGSRLAQVVTGTVPELEAHLGPLSGRRVLDFGCGTGSTLVGLHAAGAIVTGYDISEESVRLLRLRAAEHGFEAEAAVAPRISDTSVGEGFDIVLMNAVIEHVPASVERLRAQVLGDAYSRVAPGGYLVLNQTPNRLWPRDIYATGLWWIPWSRPGSARAYRRAVARGRHVERPGLTPGGRGLEERGAWGVTYREVASGVGDGQCLNAERGHDIPTRLTGPPLSFRRRVAERLVHTLLTRTVGVPVVAVVPMFSPLIFRRPDAGRPQDPATSS